MSFAVWQQKPPFVFAPSDPEQIYSVGDKWVVTDNPARATQAQVDAVLNAPLVAKRITDGDLAALLVKKLLITQADIDAALAK